MTPDPTLARIASGPKSACVPSDDWLVARAVEEDRERIAALEGHWRWLQQCMEADDARIKRLESPPARATGELADAVAMVELTRRDLADARRERDEARADRETEKARADALVGDVRRWIDGYNVAAAARLYLQQQLAEMTDERDSQRDRANIANQYLVDVQQQLAESRAALARIAEYQADPGRSFHQDYVNVKGIAKDALATATPEASE